MDGANENANKYTLALCELLVSIKLVDKIVVTRLPVGHTHEDIDARFGNIWTYIREKTVATPQKYLQALISVWSGEKKAKVVDIFATPGKSL